MSKLQWRRDAAATRSRDGWRYAVHGESVHDLKIAHCDHEPDRDRRLYVGGTRRFMGRELEAI